MIGEGYVCEREECAGHAVCSAVFLEPAPRAGCGCHNCAQRRLALKHERQVDADPSVLVAAQRAKRRNERKAGLRPRLGGASRLLHHMNGGYDRKRPSASVA